MTGSLALDLLIAVGGLALLVATAVYAYFVGYARGYRHGEGVEKTRWAGSESDPGMPWPEAGDEAGARVEAGPGSTTDASGERNRVRDP